jgi:UDP-sugar pyrophosphorylase
VTLIKQEKVPCLSDNAAHLCCEPGSPFSLQTKPHGHGDVHSLLHSSGLARKWQQQGLQWVCFFQVCSGCLQPGAGGLKR